MNTDLMKLALFRRRGTWVWRVPGYDHTVVCHGLSAMYFPYRDIFGREMRRSFDVKLQRAFARTKVRDLIEEAGELSECQ
jgi:hypothetical protein